MLKGWWLMLFFYLTTHWSLQFLKKKMKKIQNWKSYGWSCKDVFMFEVLSKFTSFLIAWKSMKICSVNDQTIFILEDNFMNKTKNTT